MAKGVAAVIGGRSFYTTGETLLLTANFNGVGIGSVAHDRSDLGLCLSRLDRSYERVKEEPAATLNSASCLVTS
jgi:hypothetical protein